MFFADFGAFQKRSNFCVALSAMARQSSTERTSNCGVQILGSHSIDNIEKLHTVCIVLTNKIRLQNYKDDHKCKFYRPNNKAQARPTAA